MYVPYNEKIGGYESMKKTFIQGIILCLLLLLLTACKVEETGKEDSTLMTTQTSESYDEYETDETVMDETEQIVEEETEQLTEEAFLMMIEDVFELINGGVVVVGTISYGLVSENELLEMINSDGVKNYVQVGGIEILQTPAKSASAGDSIGLELKNVKKDSIEIGDYLTSIDGFSIHDFFLGKVTFNKEVDETLINEMLVEPYYFGNELLAFELKLLEDSLNDKGEVAAEVNVTTEVPLQIGMNITIYDEEVEIAILEIESFEK